MHKLRKWKQRFRSLPFRQTIRPSFTMHSARPVTTQRTTRKRLNTIRRVMRSGASASTTIPTRPAQQSRERKVFLPAIFSAAARRPAASPVNRSSCSACSAPVRPLSSKFWAAIPRSKAGFEYPNDLHRLTPADLRDLGEKYLAYAKRKRGTAKPFFVDKCPYNF